MGEKKEKTTFQWVKAVGVGIMVAIFLRTFFFSTYIVDGESMMPTLQDGNLVVINKLHMNKKALERGDIVVFHANKRADYVKRIIGIPGDVIAYKDDVLYINGKLYEEPYLEEYKTEHESQLITGTFSLYDITGEYKVPKGSIFVLGDNRLKSYDSRYFGFVKIDKVVGTLDLRYWPIDHVGMYFK